MNPLDGITTEHALLLGSKSPRRRHLLKELGISFTTLPDIETDESFSANMSPHDVPVYLSKMKALAYMHHLRPKDILITADTIVSLHGEILGKPRDLENASTLLKKLSGNCHEVISGVCLTSVSKQKAFHSISKVYFKKLSNQEIHYYLNNFKPLDKAGAYGIQEWIGYIGIEKIEGSFYNVMGLPIQMLYSELLEF